MRSFLVSLFLVGSVVALVLPVRMLAHSAFLQFPQSLTLVTYYLARWHPRYQKGRIDCGS